MSVVEKERVVEKQDHDAPRMRHLCWTFLIEQGIRSVALCGYRLPTIPGLDLEADLGPAETSDCVVCWDIYMRANNL